ncbi:MAG: hypothetical protein PHN41_04835 [Bacteroidales bacterium]|nr:hypothetical protein [Bacteroidales bacterium]MDX9798388.1 hypothetical protein [Bacteroidales bacterium]
MQQIKIYILSALFAIGLLVSPTVSFEERVDVVLKFESGLLIKNKAIFGYIDSIISVAKTNSRTNLELILSERRNGLSKLRNVELSDLVGLSFIENPFNRYSYCLSKYLQRYKITKSIYQLKSLLI